MARLFVAALRANPHVINFVALSAAIMAPVLYYAKDGGPTGDQLASTLAAAYKEDVARSTVASHRIGTFWDPTHRNAAEMDAVYSSLLRAGATAQTRQHHLTGAAAATTAHADPAYARQRALLSTVTGVASEGAPITPPTPLSTPSSSSPSSPPSPPSPSLFLGAAAHGATTGKHGITATGLPSAPAASSPAAP